MHVGGRALGGRALLKSIKASSLKLPLSPGDVRDLHVGNLVARLALEGRRSDKYFEMSVCVCGLQQQSGWNYLYGTESK